MAWGRRRRRNYPTRNPDERASIGDSAVDMAVSNLSVLAMRTVGLMTKYEYSMAQTLPMILRDDDIAKATAVMGIVDARNDRIGYIIDDSCTLFVDYDESPVVAIEAERLYIQPDRVGPLLRHIAAVRAIHEQFEAVKYVLRWMNREATPGAIRYYWPTAMQLCPKAPCWETLQNVPSRYKEPDGIRDRMQLIQDSASCVVSSLLLPNSAEATQREAMWLTFSSYEPKPDLNWMTDQLTYYI